MANSAPRFFTSETIKRKDRSQIVSVKTGITEIDLHITGLNKKEVSVISGVPGSGKSSWLSQLALQVVDSGHKVVLYSGELEESRVYDWLELQAAGKWNTKKHPNYENFYYVSGNSIRDDIRAWLAQKLFIYNNEYGSGVGELMDSLEECIVHKKVDVIILDNLMSMDIGADAYDKNDKQSQYMKGLKKFTRENDVHTILVAHPRKAMGFLRRDDISGTSDLVNLADNLFVIHRVNADFKRLSKATFGWKVDSTIYNYDNVIEICKNRDFGVQDYFVGLYYEKETKRFKNTQDEERHYGWEREITEDTQYKLPFDL